MKVLIVEDQADLVKNMKQYLELEKFVVEVAYDGEEAEALIDSEVYDVIILDLNLPKKDGMTVCREAREKGIGTPILILTARTAKDSIIEGLNIGADDYITKPFDMDELVARIRSAIRRSNKQPNPIIEVNESIAIDTNAKTVSRNNEFVKLAPKECVRSMQQKTQLDTKETGKSYKENAQRCRIYGDPAGLHCSAANNAD
jgi:DNA-binding response OmpR family regulator